VESGDRWLGKVICEKSPPPRLYLPTVSVEDRWVDPHEQVLKVLISCWWYGSGKPSNLSSTEAWFKYTASLVGLGEKLGTDVRIDQPTCCGLCQEPFFLGAVGSVQICRWLTKGCYVLVVWNTYGLGPYADWTWDACGVLVGFSPAGCTSIRIIATLGYE
jgi:hypothetical protein